ARLPPHRSGGGSRGPLDRGSRMWLVCAWVDTITHRNTCQAMSAAIFDSSSSPTTASWETVSMLDQPKKVRTAAGLAPLDSAIDAARLRRSWKLRYGAACLMSRLAALPSVSPLDGSPPAATALPPVSGSR